MKTKVLMIMAVFAMSSSFAQYKSAGGEAQSRDGCIFDIYNPDNSPIYWTGDCQGGFMEGPGKLTARLSGSRIYTYEGKMSKGLFTDTNGKVTYPDGDIYIGSLVKGKWDGYGQLQRLSGNTDHQWVEGQFVNGAINGNAEMLFRDGMRITGNFVEGKPIEGVIVDPKGDKYRFKDGKAQLIQSDGAILSSLLLQTLSAMAQIKSKQYGGQLLQHQNLYQVCPISPPQAREWTQQQLLQTKQDHLQAAQRWAMISLLRPRRAYNLPQRAAPEI